MPIHQSHESAERAALLRRRIAGDPTRTAEADGEPTPHPLIALQRQVGNAEVARMLAQRAAEDEEKKDEVQAKHDLASAQRQGAEEEKEEDVQAKHDLTQRQNEEEDEVQAKPEVGLEGGPLSAEVTGRINAQRGGGAPLDEGTRTSMEGALGDSFADVRLHTGAEADALNRSISAKAFTTGSDIFFRKDASPGDHGLLAHELTHVVQQRAMNHGGPLRVGPAGDSHEQHADAVSTAVTSGAATSTTAQREADEALAQRTLAQRQNEVEQEEEEKT
jgi:hypothetical protein